MSNEATELTFRKRAPSYDSESRWVRGLDFIDPLIRSLPGCVFGTFLDGCCGTGAVTDRAIACGWIVTGLDLSEEMLARCQNKRLVCGTINELPFRDKSFDVVCVRQGLQYADLDKAFPELRRVARHEVRLGQITMMSDVDELWWRSYFAIASPGRRHVFAPFQLGNIGVAYGLAMRGCEVTIAKDTLMGPINYLSPTAQSEILSLWRNAPSDIRERYRILDSEVGLTYEHRWEFVTFSP